MSQFDINNTHLKVCSRCIYDERVPAISFDSNGVCNYCKQVEQLTEEYGTGYSKGYNKIDAIIDAVKRAGVGNKYDCIVGVSGGTDSSYLVQFAKERGLRPLAVHYDNTWNSSVATTNIYKILQGLDVNLYTHVVANKESDDIFRSFFFSWCR